MSLPSRRRRRPRFDVCGNVHCEMPAHVALVDRMSGVIYDTACWNHGTKLMEEGPPNLIDYPIDTAERNKAANRAIENYYGVR